MNIFIAIMLFFAALGLLDEILGGKLGVQKDFEQGLSTMGGLSLSVVGFYTIGVSFVQANAEGISRSMAGFPFDPSLIVGSLLAPDMGALGMALNLAETQPLAIFTGALVAGGLGMTIGYQLPVFLAAVQREEIPGLMRGFIYGLITLPPGLIVGGLLLGLNPMTLLLNLIPILILSVFLIVAFLRFPEVTMRILIVFGNFIRIVSFVFFGLSVIGVFLPEYAVADVALVKEILFMVLRMVIVACGGIVLSRLVLKYFPGQIRQIGLKLGVNNESVIGLILSCTQSLAMLPLYSRMDKKGQVMNAAFSVCGAYVVGGQCAFVSSLATSSQSMAYILCKLISGLLAVSIVAFLPANKTMEREL